MIWGSIIWHRHASQRQPPPPLLQRALLWLQAQSLFRVMELRGRFVGYPVAWVLATAAWTQHGLDKVGLLKSVRKDQGRTRLCLR